MTAANQLLTVKAYVGDCKTLLAFSLPVDQTVRLAGFTIQCQPEGGTPYYLFNTLQFEQPALHAQVATEPARSSVNAPIHKFQWLHVPGSAHQGVAPVFGKYQYKVTPRYFDDQQHLKALDLALTTTLEVQVGPFEKGGLKLGFARGYTQSQAFAHHFGEDALIQPKGRSLLFDTSAQAGTSPLGQAYTYAEEYDWLGMTARQRIFDFIDEVLQDKSQYLDLFAYDLNEPDICKRLLQLAAEGRVRVILDNAALHHSSTAPTFEDQFETAFNRVCQAPAAILRGHFARYSHDKVMISFNKDKALKVLTGSTNFSTTGLYVNSNHVIVFDDSDVAWEYGDLFETVWQGNVALKPYLATPFSSKTYVVPTATVPKTSITFAPHAPAFATANLQAIADRIAEEGKKPDGKGSVLFAVMNMDTGNSPVYQALTTLHANQTVFSYGISDGKNNVSLYEPGKPNGVLVTGKPGATLLPPPFDQVPDVVGLGHQIHHKFLVCGFNTPDAVVYCGSSNLAVGGEEANGDNLLAIQDSDVATAFAIEAFGLVDHFQFMDRMVQKANDGQALNKLPASKTEAAKAAGWFLSVTDAWAKPYFASDDLRAMERTLFSGVKA